MIELTLFENLMDSLGFCSKFPASINAIRWLLVVWCLAKAHASDVPMIPAPTMQMS